MEYIALKDVCKINMGQSPDSSNYNDNEDGIPFFQGNADFGERYPVTRVWCNAPTKIAQPEDILISVRAPIGALNFAKEECCIGRGLAALTPDRSKVSLEFIYWLLKGKKAELNSKGTGSTFKAISRKVLEETMVPAIDFDKQHEYAEILEKIYSVIQKRKEELSALDDLIKARFVEMFGDPIINPNAYKRITLNDACTKVTDGTHDTPERYEEGVLLLTGKNIRATGIAFDDVEYVSEEDHRIIYDRCNPEYGDVLYTNIGVNYGTACFNNLDYEFSMKNVALLKPKRELLDGHYLWICLNYMREYILSQNQVGGAQTFMGLATIKKISIPVPSINLQKRFAEFLVQVDKSKVAVQNALDETQLLFDSLMQQYFG